MSDHARQLLARLQALEAETREALRAIRYATDDLSAALESARQLRHELAALLGGDVSATTDVSAQTSEPVPSVAEYLSAIRSGDICGRARR